MTGLNHLVLKRGLGIRLFVLEGGGLGIRVGARV